MTDPDPNTAPAGATSPYLATPAVRGPSGLGRTALIAAVVLFVVSVTV